MEEKYVFIDVYGNNVICNCVYLNLERAIIDLNASFSAFALNANALEYGKDCWKACDGMSAWANVDGKDRVWTIIKVNR